MMGGQPTAFGFEEEALRDVLQAVSVCAHLKLRGIHLYTGTQILDAELLLQHWQHAIELGKQVSDFTGKPARPRGDLKYNRYPNIPPIRVPATRLMTITLTAATAMRIMPSAAASLALPAM